jgi:hypothetical protein
MVGSLAAFNTDALVQVGKYLQTVVDVGVVVRVVELLPENFAWMEVVGGEMDGLYLRAKISDVDLLTER